MQDFQAFTVRFSRKTNVLFVKVGISQAFDPTISAIDKQQIQELLSIWDTGASCSIISKQYAKKIGLITTGKTTITGVNNTTIENTYQVNIYLPNKACITFVKIAEAPALSGGAGMLIGMDIIGAGDLSVYTEDEKTVMSYRNPSIGGTDFVKLADNIKRERGLIIKIEDQSKNRKPLSKKEKQKRKQKRKNKHQQRNKR